MDLPVSFSCIIIFFPKPFLIQKAQTFGQEKFQITDIVFIAFIMAGSKSSIIPAEHVHLHRIPNPFHIPVDSLLQHFQKVRTDNLPIILPHSFQEPFILIKNRIPGQRALSFVITDIRSRNDLMIHPGHVAARTQAAVVIPNRAGIKLPLSLRFVKKHAGHAGILVQHSLIQNIPQDKGIPVQVFPGGLQIAGQHLVLDFLQMPRNLFQLLLCQSLRIGQ